ncbi:MAG: hypothetical protein ACRDLV_13035 [Solirubrobacteraceae bacterium]
MYGLLAANPPQHFLTGAILSLVIPLAALAAVLAWWHWLQHRGSV